MKSKTPLIIGASLLALLLIGGIIFFVFSARLESLVDPASFNTGGSKIVFQNSEYVTYEGDVITNSPRTRSGAMQDGTFSYITFTMPLEGSFSNHLPDIQLGEYFPATAELNGLQVIGANFQPVSGTIRIKYVNAFCKANPSFITRWGDRSPAGIQCKIDAEVETIDSNGQVIPDVRYYGLGSIHFKSNIYKIGFGEISTPSIPQPTGWNKFLSFLSQVIKSFLSLLQPQSITGQTYVNPGETGNYDIQINTRVPDSDCSDGDCEVQYANWVLSDSIGNIVEQGSWERVFGEYKKSVTIQLPNVQKDFVLVGVVTQTNGTYDLNTKQWTWTEETPIIHEEINVKTKYSIVSPTIPQPSGWNKFWDAIKSFFKRLFGG